jgi:hypothetical protein
LVPIPSARLRSTGLASRRSHPIPPAPHTLEPRRPPADARCQAVLDRRPGHRLANQLLDRCLVEHPLTEVAGGQVGLQRGLGELEGVLKGLVDLGQLDADFLSRGFSAVSARATSMSSSTFDHRKQQQESAAGLHHAHSDGRPRRGRRLRRSKRTDYPNDPRRRASAQRLPAPPCSPQRRPRRPRWRPTDPPSVETALWLDGRSC